MIDFYFCANIKPFSRYATFSKKGFYSLKPVFDEIERGGELT